jgi:hypothetical protein
VPEACTDHAGKFTIPALTNAKVCVAARALGKQQTLATNVQPPNAKDLQLQLRVIR